MTPAQYREALAALGMTPAAKATDTALGLSVRHIQRLATGQCPVPETVALLLKCLISKQVQANENTHKRRHKTADKSRSKGPDGITEPA